MATVNEKMTAIADAIREKIGETNKRTLDDMATDIQKVYDAGKKSQYDEFWDAYQDNGNRTDYAHAFAGAGWNNANFKPKHIIRPKGSGAVHRMFFQNKSIDDFSLYNEILDFSKFDGVFDQVFYAVVASKIGIIDLSSATGLMNCFQYSTVKTIEKIILKEDGSQTIQDNSFLYMSNLENILFEGVIGASINFKNSGNLTEESLMSIINALKDYSGTSTTRTLTLHATAKAKLSESDMAIARQKGWDIV